MIYTGSICKEYPKSRYHKDDSEEPNLWYEVVDNLDDYIETSKVVINE